MEGKKVSLYDQIIELIRILMLGFFAGMLLRFFLPFDIPSFSGRWWLCILVGIIGTMYVFRFIKENGEAREIQKEEEIEKEVNARLNKIKEEEIEKEVNTRFKD